jgi:uncharacterized integral membrane protein
MAYRPDNSDVSLDETSEGVDKGRALRLGLAGVAIVLAVVFMAQNNERVETTFVFFEVTTSLWVSLLVALALGAVLGQAVEVLWARRKRRRAARDDG